MLKTQTNKSSKSSLVHWREEEKKKIAALQCNRNRLDFKTNTKRMLQQQLFAERNDQQLGLPDKLAGNRVEIN